MAGFYLGRGSRRELRGVHPDLVQVVEDAIKITEQDFTVHDGLRSADEQREYVRRGVSWTMNSMHMRQADGYGHAVDLVPYINGKLRWEWEAIYPIALAMKLAAEDLNVPIRWGGHWDRLNGAPYYPKVLVENYVARKRGQGESAFIDGPHYELIV